MDKINSIAILQSQQQLLQQMQQMATQTTMQINSNALPMMTSQPAIHTNFSQFMHQAINQINQQQAYAEEKQYAIEMGEADDLMETMLESQKAAISFSALLEVRNKLVTALDQILNTSL